MSLSTYAKNAVGNALLLDDFKFKKCYFLVSGKKPS